MLSAFTNLIRKNTILHQKLLTPYKSHIALSWIWEQH